MKKLTFKALVCLSLIALAPGFPTTTASADSRYVLPSRDFDPIAACNGLESGTSTLRGKTMSGLYLNSEIAIYPVTEYFQEFLDLRDKFESGGHQVPTMDHQARSVRRITQASEGRFEFANLKPGKYYVEAPPYYVYGEDPELDKMMATLDCVYFLRNLSVCVEIKADGEVVETEL